MSYTDLSAVKILSIFAEIEAELQAATRKHGPMQSPHEGYAVIKEEVDELWDDIKSNNSVLSQRSEAIQIAAMAIRYILDVTGEVAPAIPAGAGGGYIS